jgi:putative PIN family toxin of toxin-antitoxin system
VVLRELRRALRQKLKLPTSVVDSIEQFLREYEVVPKPKAPADVHLRDADDKWILASALEAKADVLVTGDHDLLDLRKRLPIRILDPRGFWNLVREE